MFQNTPQVPWTDEQWARARQVIVEEANRARVGASFLPLYGPLPADTDFVPKDVLRYEPEEGRARQRMVVDDRTTVPLATLQVKVYVRGAQMADPAMTSVLQLFRRAANVLARLEDVVIFRGLFRPGEELPKELEAMPAIWEILGGYRAEGLLSGARGGRLEPAADRAQGTGDELVRVVSDAVGRLEGNGHLGPFAVVFGHEFFTDVQTPNAGSLVLPQDRILPFLGGGWLLRSSTLPPKSGVVVALGGAPVELVVATDVSLNFLQVTTDPLYVFRVYEKIALRIKEADAIVAIGREGDWKANDA
jgi:uncharacterized linocin/CFP29 family protein